ncbi:MAG: ABC transporter permease [Spirochaetia bacterium]|jgi:putative ABC transport system permease protein|nr:ABC transporter permease [Spirochaetia bacterium]
MIEGILVEGLVYGIMALGLFISFRILDFPDLTVEGSFPAGAAAAGAIVAGLGKALASGAGAGGLLGAASAPGGAVAAPLGLAAAAPVLALVGGFAAGALAGLVTSFIHHRLKVPPILAGIITMTGFYSINLRILGGRPNLPLIKNNPLLDFARTWLGPGVSQDISLFIAALFAALLVAGLMDLFFHTEIGIAMGAMGDNEASVIQAGINPVSLRSLGIALANGLVGLSGALAASYQGFADVNFGAGIVASGLASVMLGELLIKSQFIGVQIFRVLAGSVLFKGLMYAARSWGYVAGITPNDLRLLTALLIIGSITVSKYAGKKPKALSRAGGKRR